MTDIDDLAVKVEALENHIRRLEGVLVAMLDEIANGSIEDSAVRMREILDQGDAEY